ncbi:MAG: DUF4279 domain-containing protein [Anaerolineales bacterium]|nr:DUF4279 domain-containing protein [Anaerolineales bacterium]MCB8952909.1 DUF4279 domain-containing protein [Ardenticatenales bacterium]
MIPEIYISLVIEEDAVDDKLLALLKEMGATESWFKGQPKGKTILTHESNGCKFSAESQPTTDFYTERVISDFWNHIKLNKKELVEIIQKNDLAPIFSVIVYVVDTVPSIHLENTLLKELAQVNIGIDIDVIIRKKQ